MSVHSTLTTERTLILKMANVFIIHGSYGSPEENWFPWLKEELEKLDCNIFVPKFPTPENQSLETWLKVFEEYEDKIDENSILIGHSLGPAFLLNILEKLNKPVKASFFVSGFLGLLDNPTFDEINKTFTDKEFNWDKIKENCPEFYVFHSDNDPYVSLQKAKELSEKLGVEVLVVKDAGHFNKETGYTNFPQLLEKIKTEL